MKNKLCVTTCKNDSDFSNILDPAQSKAVKRKVSDPAKNAKKPIFYCGSCENILKDKPKGQTKRAFVWLVIYVMYGFTTNVLGFQEKRK